MPRGTTAPSNQWPERDPKAIAALPVRLYVEQDDTSGVWGVTETAVDAEGIVGVARDVDFFLQAGSGVRPTGFTFARSSTARYVRGGRVYTEGAGRLRRHWAEDPVSGLTVPWYLLEAARTNLVTQDNLASWAGSASVTTGVDDPTGGTGAFTVTDADGVSLVDRNRGVTFTGDGVKSAIFVVRERTMASAGVQHVGIWDLTAGAWRVKADITGWVAGEPTVSMATGTLLEKFEVEGGWWVLRLQTTSVTAANTHVAYIRPALTPSATGALDVWRVNAFNSAVPPVMPLDASGALSADLLSVPWSHAPQAMQVYTRFIEGGTVNIAAGRMWHLGLTSAGTDPRLYVYAPSGFYGVAHDDGSTFVQSALSTAPSVGDVVELLATLFADGSVQIAQRINGGSVSTATASAATSLASAWAGAPNTRLYIGSDPAGGNVGLTSLDALIATLGTAHDMDWFRAAAQEALGSDQLGIDDTTTSGGARLLSFGDNQIAAILTS